MSHSLGESGDRVRLPPGHRQVPTLRAAMTAAKDPIDQLSRAVDQTEAIISRIRRDQATLPTPCSSWDVRALINHVVAQDLRQFTERASGGGSRDLVVHGWDLAKATGQPTELDPELGQLALDWGRENLRPEFRGRDFGPEVPVAEDAGLHERLAGLFGRDPDWIPSRAGP